MLILTLGCVGKDFIYVNGYSKDKLYSRFSQYRTTLLFMLQSSSFVPSMEVVRAGLGAIFVGAVAAGMCVNEVS
jgi:hypothetical protein